MQNHCRYQIYVGAAYFFSFKLQLNVEVSRKKRVETVNLSLFNKFNEVSFSLGLGRKRKVKLRVRQKHDHTCPDSHEETSKH